MDRITISTNENFKSEIIIQEDLKNNIQDFFEDKKYFLITNTTLAKLYPNFLYKFKPNRIIIVKDGEKYKNQIEQLTETKIDDILFNSDFNNWKEGKSDFDQNILYKSNLTILIEDEEILWTFKAMRDGVVFTNKRIISIFV